MKIRITQPGAFDTDGKELKIGTVLDVDGDEIPSNFLNKAESADALAAEGEAGDATGDDADKVALTNPKK